MKKLIYLLLLSVIFVSCKSKSNIITSKKMAKEKGVYEYDKNSAITKASKNKKESKYVDLNRLTVVENAKTYLGTPYRNGGMNSKGFDCSGLTYSSFKKIDINLPRNSFEQAEKGIEIKKAKAKSGDLIFFKTGKNNNINHVGIITENDNNEIKFIHSSTSKGVIISSLSEPYYDEAFEVIKRVIE